MGSAGNAELRPGDTLGRYELLAPIALGGMASVWAARLRGAAGFSKLVALKRILPEYASDREFRAMFLDEARIASKLRHPNACEVFELGEEAGVLFVSMEWVDGPSLLSVARPATPTAGARSLMQPIPHDIAVRIASETCAGLHAAHELVDDDGSPLGVVHRDVSPHNLLLTMAGTTKVTDFGVAMAIGKSHATMTGQLKGKLSYMSPEQLAIPPTVDRRADVFAVGCVLYEVTTGFRPFHGENDARVVTAILKDERATPRELDRAFPPGLEAIILRAMAHDPAQRFATADELRRALDAYLVTRGGGPDAAAVAQLVRARCGVEQDRQRETVRAAMVATGGPPSARGSRPSLSSIGTESQPSPAVTGAEPTRTTMSFGSRHERAKPWIAFLTGLALVGIAFVGARHYLRGLPVEAGATATSAVVAPASAPVPAATAPAEPVSTRVTFRVVPADATLFMDGVSLPPSVDAVQRPTPGTEVVVTFRADQFEEKVVTVEASSPRIIDVVLPIHARPPRRRARRSLGVRAREALPRELPHPAHTEANEPPLRARAREQR